MTLLQKPVEAPTSPTEAREGSDGAEAGVGLQDAPERLTKRRRRQARGIEAAKAKTLSVWADPSTRARALAAVTADVEGSEAPPVRPPVPLSIACEAAGLSPWTVLDALERGDLPELHQARARGRALVTRLACGAGPDARQWAWLAERLAPKELHLPTKVHTGQDPDAAPAAHRVAIDLVDARSLARGVVATVAAVPALPGKR